MESGKFRKFSVQNLIDNFNISVEVTAPGPSSSGTSSERTSTDSGLSTTGSDDCDGLSRLPNHDNTNMSTEIICIEDVDLRRQPTYVNTNIAEIDCMYYDDNLYEEIIPSEIRDFIQDETSYIAELDYLSENYITKITGNRFEVHQDFSAIDNIISYHKGGFFDELQDCSTPEEVIKCFDQFKKILTCYQTYFKHLPILYLKMKSETGIFRDRFDQIVYEKVTTTLLDSTKRRICKYGIFLRSMYETSRNKSSISNWYNNIMKLIENIDQSQEQQEKIGFLIAEIIKTEETEIKRMEDLLNNFSTIIDNEPKYKGKRQLLLGSEFDNILKLHKEFLEDLKKCYCDDSLVEVANYFLHYKHLFRLYLKDLKSKGKVELLQEFKKFAEDRQLQFDVHIHINRLFKYKQYLDNMHSLCIKDSLPYKEVENAQHLIDKILRAANEIDAIKRIAGTNLDLENQGELLKREKFTVTDDIRDSYEGMAFLFEKALVFTEIMQKGFQDVYVYRSHILTTSMTIYSCDSYFTVYLHNVRRDSPHTLKAEKSTNEEWIAFLRAMLMKQFEKAKKESMDMTAK